MSPRKSRGTKRLEELLNRNYIRGSVFSCRESLRSAGIEPAPVLLDSITAYIELLLRWNLKINLTAITDPQEIVTRDFVESFLAARWLPTDAGVLCDVGSGAGFPGLALKLVLPHWHVILLEPRIKKSAFLAEAARALRLASVEVNSCRWEESEIEETSLDAVTSRALGSYPELAEWARKRLRPGGRLILWLGATHAAVLAELNGWKWEQESVPGSRERVLLMGTPS